MEREFLYSKKRCLSILPCCFLEEITITKNEKVFCTRVYSVKKICGHIWVNVWIFNFTESTTSHLCMQPCTAMDQNNLIHDISLVHATLQCYGSKQSDPRHLTCACNPALLWIKTIWSTTSHLCMQPCSAMDQNNLIHDISLVHATLQCYGSKQSDPRHLTCACNPAVLWIKTIWSTTSHLCMQPCSAMDQNNLIHDISLVHATLQCCASKQSDPLLRISTNILQYCKVTTTVQYSFMLTHNWKDHR